MCALLSIVGHALQALVGGLNSGKGEMYASLMEVVSIIRASNVLVQCRGMSAILGTNRPPS